MEHTRALLFPLFLHNHSDQPTDHGDGDGHMVSNMVIWLVGHMVGWSHGQSLMVEIYRKSRSFMGSK